MKNLYFLLTVLMLSCALSAQNYRAYVPGRPAYFHTNTGMNSWFYETTRAIAEDTSWTNGTHRIFESFREERPSGDQFFQPCFQFDTSWVGTHFEQDTVSGETWFFNYEGDTIRFIPSATNGQTGMFCRLANGNVMRGVVASAGVSGVMTTSDSIRILILQHENAIGNPLAHPLNGKLVIVSKQYGLVRTYAWSDFPMDTVSYTLSGMENPVVGQRIITATQIFDYNIGDRFDWYTMQTYSNPPSPAQYYYYSITITNKVVNGNIVTYDFLQDYAHKIGNTVISQSWGIASSMTIDFTMEDTQYELPMRPFDMITDPDTTHNWGSYFGYATMPYAPTILNGRQLKGHYNGPPYYYDSTQQCYSGLTVSFGPCDGAHNVWGEGIGKVYGYAGSPTCMGIYSLVYYEKGAETWGTPHNWSVLLNTGESVFTPQVINVYPNPAEDVINVNLPSVNGGQFTYQIYNSFGQLVSNGSATFGGGAAQIPVNQLAAGVYELVISDERNVWRGTFAH